MEMKRILQALDSSSTKPVEGVNDIKKALSVINEGSNPHKVALPVQMAMQHYQKPEEKAQPKQSLLKQYFQEAEDVIANEAASKKERLRMYSQHIAERVLMKENSTINEAPIEPMDDPNDPMIYGHQKANPMNLKGRIHQARNQLRELAQMAESDDLGVWEQITKLAKGGMFMGLEQNLEQIRHGIAELAAKRKKGGIGSRGITKNIGE